MKLSELNIKIDDPLSVSCNDLCTANDTTSQFRLLAPWTVGTDEFDWIADPKLSYM